MFAKLKKKIEEQGGSVADGEKLNSSANASTPLKGNKFYICVKARTILNAQYKSCDQFNFWKFSQYFILWFLFLFTVAVTITT